jgi:hypothetical protein
MLAAVFCPTKKKRQMINANELRIGNLVMDRSGKTLCIDWFEKDKVCMSMGEFSFMDDKFPLHPMTEYFEYLKPISLSEEILFKYGFEINDDLGDQKFYQIPNIKRGFGVEKDHDEWSLYYYWDNGANNYYTILYDEKHFIYLHQLQNLWFCLTGQELSVVANGS